MRVSISGHTHVGKKRKHNEDAFCVVPEDQLVVVCDGMGGHSCGEVASQLATDEVRSFFKATRNDRDFTWPFKEEKGLKWDENRLVCAVKLANQAIFDAARADRSKEGMGTTLVSAVVRPTSVAIAHVGDSRCYRFRGDDLELLTEDHSLLNEYIRLKNPNDDEIARFPHKNVICRALGLRPQVKVDVNRVEPLLGDVLVLCSDGLCGMVDDDVIRDVGRPFVRRLRDGDADALDELSLALIDTANAAGGKDNITCAAVHLA